MLEAKGITFGYSKNALIYDDFHMAVGSDERVVLRGPSGLGKTTLCRILSGYLKPLSGEVLVDGTPLSPKSPVIKAGKSRPVQLINQHPERTLDPRLKMFASLEEAAKESDGIDDELLSELGIKRAWLTRYPHELSGGELQRFSIARSLLAHPRYLVADEITTMLDAVTQAEIWRFLMEECHRKNIGMVIVSHSQPLIECIATRVIEMANQAQVS